jgi:hypothetical protein
MASLTASQVFSQLAQLAEQNIFTNAVPVINSTLLNIEANPAQWTNPLSAALLGNQFLVNLLATLPSLENSAVTSAATLVQSVLTTVNTKIEAAAAPVTAVSVGAEIGNAIAPGASS